MARKRNLKRQTESLLIVVQNITVRTTYVKAKTDDAQENSKYMLCGDRGETINQIISECSKLAQREYMTRHIWVCNGIHLELSKKLKFDNSTKIREKNRIHIE